MRDAATYRCHCNWYKRYKMFTSFQAVCLANILFACIALEVARARKDVPISRVITVPVDPSAATVFPNAQLSAACGIVTLEGLGLGLDGDYTLADELASAHGGKPVWIGTSPDMQHQVLAWQPTWRAWTIGIRGFSVFRAFAPVDTDMPPAYSSQWQVLTEDPNVVKVVSNAVSIFCPACAAVAVSALPSALAPCNGPYRLQAKDTAASSFVWIHVSDERCTMLHDKAGHSIVVMSHQSPNTGGTAAAANGFYPTNIPAGWTNMMEDKKVRSDIGKGGAKVVCTSAGHSTRFVVDMVKPSLEMEAENKAETGPPRRRKRFELVTTHDGSIISSNQENVHLRISREGMLGAASVGVGEMSPHSEHEENMDLSALRVKITGDAGELLTTSLAHLYVDGVPLSLHGLEGTIVVGICVFENHGGDAAVETWPEGCLAETMLIFEVFSEETHMVQRRSSSETAVSSHVSMTNDLGAVEDAVKETRVVFSVDLKVVDGAKLSILHLMKHLPENFRASALDLSCASGDLPMKEIFDKESIDVTRLCIRMLPETVEAAKQDNGDIYAFLYSLLVRSTTWEDIMSARPDIAGALKDLHSYLTKFDTIVMSNGGKDKDAYLLHVARLAGVKIRMINLGAITGGYMSPRFPSGATSFIAPSHYVAHNQDVIRNAGGCSVKVCHPVMDAARVLEAADSCLTNEQQVGQPPPVQGELPRETHSFLKEYAGDDDDRPSATFVMVSRAANTKTPGMFVRAMGVVERRRLGSRERGRRRIDGVMVGEGPLRGHMETLAQKVNANITFTGFLAIEAVPCEVQRATAIIVPSICSETFGMVGPEAMILGVPVITFGFGGTGELVRHMENGIVVAEPTPRALADALEFLANDPVLRDRLGTQARLDGLRALSLAEMVACHADEMS